MKQGGRGMESRDTVGGRGLTGPGWDGVQDGRTALYAASENGHGEVVEKLLEKGASVDVQDKVRGREGGMWEGRSGGAGRGGSASRCSRPDSWRQCHTRPADASYTHM